MGRSLGFGSTASYSFALLRLAFASASHLRVLNLALYCNSPVRSTKSTQSHVSIVLLLLVSIRFQVLFHSPPGVLFTFPSRYWFTIGCQGVFSLMRWSSLIPTRFLVSRSTWVLFSHYHIFSPTGLLPSVVGLSRPIRLIYSNALLKSPATPVGKPTGLGSSHFARRYFGNRVFFLFLGVLRCFSSPGLASYTYLFSI